MHLEIFFSRNNLCGELKHLTCAYITVLSELLIPRCVATVIWRPHGFSFCSFTVLQADLLHFALFFQSPLAQAQPFWPMPTTHCSWVADILGIFTLCPLTWPALSQDSLWPWEIFRWKTTSATVWKSGILQLLLLYFNHYLVSRNEKWHNGS